MSARDNGKAFLTELLAHVPEESRAAVQAAVEGSEQALDTLGAAVLRQSDYSRKQDETAAWKQQLDDWYAQNKATLDAAARPTPPVTPPATDPIQSPATATFLTREDFAKEIRAQQAQAVAAIVHTNQLSTKHFKTFGEVLDIEALMKDPQIEQIGLLGVYDKTFKPRYEEIRTKAENDRIEAEVQKRLADSRRLNPQLPYPVNGREASHLDVLEARNADGTPVATPSAVDVLSTAVDQYNQAVAARSGVPA